MEPDIEKTAQKQMPNRQISDCQQQITLERGFVDCKIFPCGWFALASEEKDGGECEQQ